MNGNCRGQSITLCNAQGESQVSPERKRRTTMTEFKGFETREEAMAYRKKNGGYLCWDRRSKRDGRPIGVGIDYAYAVHLGGLDPKKYPYCLQWNNR